jgi:tRNA threonylcarbamoyladenosine biosynthesis protein TsaE
MFTSTSAVETEEVAAQLARGLHAGDVLALVGDLGSGKTQFVKGLTRGLGSEATVTSPTFTLIHEYTGGRLPLYHFDFYRLDRADALAAIGFDEYVFGDGVSAIEWADRFPDAVPPHARWIKIDVTSPTTRSIDFAPRESPLPEGED